MRDLGLVFKGRRSELREQAQQQGQKTWHHNGGGYAAEIAAWRQKWRPGPVVVVEV